jgi:hypothetical protein
MTQAEQDLQTASEQKMKLLTFCSEWFTKGGTDAPKPTDPVLAMIADMFEMRCSDRDVMLQRLQETVAQVAR